MALQHPRFPRPLGVDIAEGYRDEVAAQPLLRAFRRNVVLITAVAAVTVFLSHGLDPLQVVLVWAAAVAATLNEASYRKRLLAIAAQSGWLRPDPADVSDPDTPQAAIGLLTQNPAPRFPWMFLAATLAPIAVTAALVAARWDEIPQSVPIHWGEGLEPDAFAEKSLPVVFAGIIFALLTVAFMMLLVAVFTHAVRTPMPHQDVATRLRMRRYVSATNQGFAVLMLLMGPGLALLQLIGIVPQFQHLTTAAFIFFILSTVFGSLAIIVPLAGVEDRIKKQLRDAGLPTTSNSELPAEHYKWGMFYVNAQDPAILVDKRFGIGIDFNYAHWHGKSLLALTVLFMVTLLIFVLWI